MKAGAFLLGSNSRYRQSCSVITMEKDSQQIQREVFSETSLRKLLKYFPDYKSLFVFHTTRMQEAFPPKSHLDACDFCKRQAAHHNAQFEWKGDYYDVGKTTALLFLGILIRHPIESKPDYEVRFTTNHRLCKSCVSVMKWKRVFAEIVDNLSIVFLLLSVVLFVSGLSLFGAAIGWKLERTYLFWSFAGIIVGGFSLVGFIRYIFMVYSWIVPKEFRMIAKHPFKLVQIK
jgi:hypothetical protein